MQIIYPKEWQKKKNRQNAYGRCVGGEYIYSRNITNGFEQISNKDYVEGYRKAIKDVKKLNTNKAVNS